MLLSLPGSLQKEVVKGQIQQSVALTEGQVLGGSTIDVVDQIKRSQTALLKGWRAWQDVFHKQNTINALTAAIQHQTCRQKKEINLIWLELVCKNTQKATLTSF